MPLHERITDARILSLGEIMQALGIITALMMRKESLMNLSPKLGELNFERYLTWQYPFNGKDSGSSLLMFQGDVYQGMEAGKFNQEEIAKRLVSAYKKGFYFCVLR